MYNPLVSIIIPTFNRAHLIGETLESVIAQTYQNWECIVVDDGSTDYTEELMEFYCSKDKSITYHQRPKGRRKGPNSCRNFGFEISKGSYNNWMDSDDILVPQAIERKIENIGNNDVLITGLNYVDEFKKPIPLIHHFIPKKNIIEEYFIGRITFYTFTPLWKKSFLNGQKELFDEKISNLDDWDFNLRMLYEKPSIAYLHEPLIKYRLHNNSLSQEIRKLNFQEIKSEFFARKKHFNLLKGNKTVNLRHLRCYDKERCKSILRQALNDKNSIKFPLLGMLIRRQILLSDFFGLIKTSFGFFSFSIFGKGDRFFRRKFP